MSKVSPSRALVAPEECPPDDTIQVLDVVRVPEKAAYPLRRPISLSVVPEPAGISIEPLGNELRGLLTGRGPTLETAKDDFGRGFDRLIQENRAIPPHARTSENEQIALILDDLVDWERYEQENPLIQPMWGQVRERRTDGSLRIYWVIGPNEIDDQEAILRSQDVHPSLANIPVGRWFYGAARCYQDRVDWIDPPGEAPDPEDEAARLEVWESLPIEYADEPGCWPVHEE